VREFVTDPAVGGTPCWDQGLPVCLWDRHGSQVAYRHLILPGILSDLEITEQQRFRFTSLMRLAADDAGMPNDPEFRSALVAYLEWGTRIALGNSRPDTAAMEHSPVLGGAGEAPPISSSQTGVLRVSAIDHPMFQISPTPGNPT
jgi:hypothetical protein